MDCSPPGSFVHGILQARILEWVAMASSRGSSRPRDRTQVSCTSCIARWSLYHWATWEAPSVKWGHPNTSPWGVCLHGTEAGFMGHYGTEERGWQQDHERPEAPSPSPVMSSSKTLMGPYSSPQLSLSGISLWHIGWCFWVKISLI